ncbi:unnamed protein product [Merluccius merluccius]
MHRSHNGSLDPRFHTAVWGFSRAVWGSKQGGLSPHSAPLSRLQLVLLHQHQNHHQHQQNHHQHQQNQHQQHHQHQHP